MQINLQDLEGCWYINMSNFPMWLKGDKTNPTLNYSIQQKGTSLGLTNTVNYQQNETTKSIKGFDSVLNIQNTAFKWRGKGVLSLLTSKWSIAYWHPDKKWAIIAFQKTLFTPQGYDVISKQKELSVQELLNIKHHLKRLNLMTNLISLLKLKRKHNFKNDYLEE